mgnify:CR=1 FL=1
MNNTTNEGSKLYLYSITSVAILGGLLFGYDTAVISGAEKGLEAFFLSASDFQYNKVMHGITSSSALIGCVLGGALSGVFASRLGRRNSLRLHCGLLLCYFSSRHSALIIRKFFSSNTENRIWIC